MKNQWIVIATLLAAAAASNSARAATCGINFDDYNGIKGVVGAAISTFAVKTSISSDVSCPDTVTTKTFPDSRMLHPSCRMYEQPCGTGTNVFAWDQSPFQHYHLLYEDPAYAGTNGCTPGYHKVNNVCVLATDPAALKRYFGSMASDAWLEIGRTTSPISTVKPFAMYSVDVKSGPIQLWFKRTNGTVAGWNSLPQGNWLIPTGDVVGVWIASASGNTNIYELWDFAVTAL
jgi:hypothetical protein